MTIGLGIGLGITIGGNGSGGSGPSYDSNAATLFAAMPVQPSAARKQLISDAFVSLKSQGAFALLDVLHVPAGHDLSSVLLNWKNPALYPMQIFNSVTFTVDRGLQGDGISGDIDTGYSYAGASQFTQDAASIGGYVNATPSDVGNTAAIIGMDVTSGSLAFLRPKEAAGSMAGRVNSSVNTNTSAVATRLGHSAVSRINSTQLQFYKDGSPLGGALSNTSFAPQAKNMRYFRLGSGYGADRIAYTYAGGLLSSAQHASIASTMLTFLTAIGAN